MSASESCAVSIRIGFLKPFLRTIFTASRPSRSGKPTSMITRSGCALRARLNCFGAVFCLQNCEFVVQCELFGKRLPQIVIVVGDQNGADLGHHIFPRCLSQDRAGRRRQFAAPESRQGEAAGQNAKERGRTSFDRFLAGLPGFEVAAAPRSHTSAMPRGWLIAGATQIPCAIGRSGIGREQSRGRRQDAGRAFCDPIFSFPVRRRLSSAAEFPRSADPARQCLVRRSRRSPLQPTDPNARGSSESGFGATDHLYDVVGVIDYNIRPRIRGRGSAIFFHLGARGPLSDRGLRRAPDRGHAPPAAATLAGVRCRYWTAHLLVRIQAEPPPLAPLRRKSPSRSAHA